MKSTSIKLVIAALLLQSAVISLHAQNKIMVAAHRGDWRNAPENSLRAFIYATDMGVDYVELDLAKTKDGELVIMHDGTIDRTTDGKGKPADYTLAEIQKFRLRSGMTYLTNNHIPTFREVMTALKGRPVKVNLDKSFPYYREAYAILQETGTLSQALFKSGETYEKLKQTYPDLIDHVAYMPVVDLDKSGAKSYIQDYLAHMKSYAFELIFSKDTSAILAHPELIKKTGAKIWINSLWPSLDAGHDDDKAVEENNKKDSWDWLIAHGVDIIQTDRPQNMLEYLKQKGLHH